MGLSAAVIVGVVIAGIMALLWVLHSGSDDTQKVMARLQQEYDIKLAKLKSELADKITTGHEVMRATYFQTL